MRGVWKQKGRNRESAATTSSWGEQLLWASRLYTYCGRKSSFSNISNHEKINKAQFVRENSRDLNFTVCFACIFLSASLTFFLRSFRWRETCNYVFVCIHAPLVYMGIKLMPFSTSILRSHFSASGLYEVQWSFLVGGDGSCVTFCYKSSLIA